MEADAGVGIFDDTGVTLVGVMGASTGGGDGGFEGTGVAYESSEGGRGIGGSSVRGGGVMMGVCRLDIVGGVGCFDMVGGVGSFGVGGFVSRRDG